MTSHGICLLCMEISKDAKIRNRYNQVPHLTQDTNGKVTNSHTQRNLNKLEMVQRRVARFVKGDSSRTSSVTAMLADLQWNTLQQRRMLSKTFMWYRVVHQLVSIPVTPFLIPTRASRGNNMIYAIPRSTVNAHLYSFFQSAIHVWKQLPSSTVSAQSFETFRD